MQCSDILKELESLADPEAAKAMQRFGITARHVYGVPVPVLRKMAKEIGTDHSLAASLWACNSLEARLLACFIEDPAMVTRAQMDAWAGDLDSWAVCDQCCMLFDKTPFAYGKAVQWSSGKQEFVKRAGFALMACLAVHDKQAKNECFEVFFPIIIGGSSDERNMVKKAVNWALRQIGKRNISLNKKALKAAREMQKSGSKTAKWIASDAIRELESDVVQKRIGRKR